MKIASTGLALILWLAPGVRADVTIRYQSEMKPAAALQPFMAALMKMPQTGSATSIQMKGNKGFTVVGSWNQIVDFAKQDVTLLDPAHKTCTTMPLSQLADKMAAAMPQATAQQMDEAGKAMAAVKADVASRMTGKTAEIQGVRAEEREITVGIDIPLPVAASQSGPGVKMVIHIWAATKEEALRVPAIRELTGYQAWQKYLMNPVGMMEKISGKMPGMSKTIGPVLEEVFKNPSVILRTHLEIYMPMLAMVAKQMAGQGGAPPFDPNAPMMEMNQEVTDLSNAPVDAGLFEIPKDYTEVAADAMIRDLIKAQQ